jgi:hypothetical protein
MLALECSRRSLKLVVKQWKLTSSTCLVTLTSNIFEWEKTMFKTIQIALLKSWNKHFASDLEL